jgi:hypothetical protein
VTAHWRVKSCPVIVDTSGNVSDVASLSSSGLVTRTVEAITVAGVLSITKTQHTLAHATGSTYAVTLAAPTSAQMGMAPKTISCINATPSVTLATTNIVGSGGSTITFDTAGDSITLVPIQRGQVPMRGTLSTTMGRQ